MRTGLDVGEPWGASLGTTVPLLAQKVLQIVHQLLRVELVVTQRARRLVPCRVIVLLKLPYIGLGRGVLRHRLVAAGPKGLHGRIEVGSLQVQVEQTSDGGQQHLPHRRIRRPLQILGRLPHQYGIDTTSPLL